MTKERPVDWLPRNHDDVERAQALLERPADDLAPVIPELIRWLKNDAWPVAGAVAECLRNLESATIPAVRHVLRGNDPIFKRNLIRCVVSLWPAQDVAIATPELGQLVSDSQSWGADLEALKVLLRHSLIDRDAAAEWVAFKRARYSEFVAQLEEVASLLVPK